MTVPPEVLRALLRLKISNTSRERSMRQEATVQSFGGLVVSESARLALGFWQR